MAEAQTRQQHNSDVTKGVGQVQACDAAPILDGEVARRSVQATPDAEDCPLRADLGMGSKLLGGLRPPDVEFVDGR